MPRRVSLPSADALFRPTPPADGAPAAPTPAPAPAGAEPVEPGGEPVHGSRPGSPRRPSGRVRHDEKMTVYVTSEELVDIEHARLALRRTHGLAVDRGRLVRVAVALALADLEAQGEHSALVRRLSDG